MANPHPGKFAHYCRECGEGYKIRGKRKHRHLCGACALSAGRRSYWCGQMKASDRLRKELRELIF